MSGLELLSLFHKLAILLFFVGVFIKMSLWFKGGIEGVGKLSIVRKIGYIINYTVKILFSKKIIKILQVILLDIILQRRILRESMLRWVMSISLTWGFLGHLFLFYLGILLNIGKDVPWYALLRELSGVMIFIGIFIAIYRRFIVRAPQLKSKSSDRIAIILLALIMVLGYLFSGVGLIAAKSGGINIVQEVEKNINYGVAIESAENPNIEKYSFVSYAVENMLKGLNLPWNLIYLILVYSHVIISIIFIIYIPWSKFFHMFIAPLVLIINSVIE